MVDETAPWHYSSRVIETRQTDVFKVWFAGLRDRRAVQVIAGRIARVQRGALGDVQSVGDGVSEMRIHYGPGYRLYCTWKGEALVILLCAGDKSTQTRDISRAKTLAMEV